MSSTTIVVPVYGDWASLESCIESLKIYTNANYHQVMLVNDCGPEVDTLEVNIKKSIKGSKNFKYYRNDKNLGFVGTCNRAVNELDKTDNDILLLNSDTEVTEDFLEEMIAVLYSDERNGAVSPRSNNATLATIPLSAAPNKGIEQQDSYELFLKLRKYLPRQTIVPVAHGFCMLIRRDLIKKYGLFDKVFGKGYGEEVDFCRRILKKGYRSLLANHAYVFHLEARSFSLEKKAMLLEVNNKIVWERYPEYRQEVRDYMQHAKIQESKAELMIHLKRLSLDRIKNKTIVQMKKSIIIRKIVNKVRKVT